MHAYNTQALRTLAKRDRARGKGEGSLVVSDTLQASHYIRFYIRSGIYRFPFHEITIYLWTLTPLACMGHFSQVSLIQFQLFSWPTLKRFLAFLHGENFTAIFTTFSVVIWFSTGTLHGENFMAIFTTLSVVIWFSTGTLGIFATLVYVFTMRVVIYDIRVWQ